MKAPLFRIASSVHRVRDGQNARSSRLFAPKFGTAELGADYRGHLAAEQLDGSEYLEVRHAADVHLEEVAAVPEGRTSPRAGAGSARRICSRTFRTACAVLTKLPSESRPATPKL
jgi:hypothetical protein